MPYCGVLSLASSNNAIQVSALLLTCDICSTIFAVGVLRLNITRIERCDGAEIVTRYFLKYGAKMGLMFLAIALYNPTKCSILFDLFFQFSKFNNYLN